MKFGVREICDVVLRAKATQRIGNKIFFKHEPVIYFDTLKTSSLEGTATTNYATGGRGNARLMAWEGERTVTFTMEDALISPEGFMILSGAGLIEASEDNVIYQHMTETLEASQVKEKKVELSYEPYAGDNENYIYIFCVSDGEIISEPYVITKEGVTAGSAVIDLTKAVGGGKDWEDNFKNADSIIVDYYHARTSKAKQIEITADKFGGNYYLEASTLFRNQAGVDMPAEFIIPNCKIQSNFTFTMASSGDPSTFTFTMDAFPDYTRFDRSKKVLAAIQIIEDPAEVEDLPAARTNTWQPETAESVNG